MGDYKSPGFHRSNLFLRRIANPPGRLAEDFSGRLAEDFSGRLAEDFSGRLAEDFASIPLGVSTDL